MNDNMVETQVYRGRGEIDRRLAELGLNLERLNKVREVARGASADATPYHPANAAGTFAYQHGTWALRDQFVGKEWKPDTTDGVEAISNETVKVKVIFANVDIACDDRQFPKPRSRKGAGAERACMGNLFGDLPIYAPRTNTAWATYYFMMDANGEVELTRPVIKGNTFSAYVERIYLPSLNNEDIDLGNDDSGNDVIDLDPVVARK